MSIISFKKHYVEKQRKTEFELMVNEITDKLATQLMGMLNKDDEKEFRFAMRGMMQTILDAEHQFNIRQGRG